MIARDPTVQEVEFASLRDLGITLIAADSEQSFLDDTPMSHSPDPRGADRVHRAMTVAGLRGARERRQAATGRKVEGRKAHGELRPEVVELVRLLRRRRPKGGRMTLREIGDELARRGFLNERGRLPPELDPEHAREEVKAYILHTQVRLRVRRR